MNLSSNVNFFLGLQSQMRINHWQTKGFARHEAFGGFYETVDPLIDQFLEQAMGKYGRFTLDEETKTIELSNFSEIDLKNLLNTLRNALNQFSEQCEPQDTDLLNLRDEILGEVNKLGYLLTLE